MEKLNATRRRTEGQRGHGMRVGKEDARCWRKSLKWKRVPCVCLTFLRRARFGDAILGRHKARGREKERADARATGLRDLLPYLEKPFLHVHADANRGEDGGNARACMMAK